MSHEVFDHTDLAQALNQHFVCILVDREERPDIDHLYMEACIALTGIGGWPLNIFMTPDKAPFYAGTYLPEDAFLRLSQSIVDVWTQTPEKLQSAAQQVFSAIDVPSPKEKWNEALPQKAFEALSSQFDPVHGGFGTAPKFPSPHILMFLQRYGICYENSNAIAMAQQKLDQMKLGGMFDQVGGGFFSVFSRSSISNSTF